MSTETSDDASLRQVSDRRHFDATAERYGRKDDNASSGLARLFRCEATFDAAPLPRRLDLLEVGCGAGFAVAYLGDRVRSYLGVDHSSELVDIARARFRRSDVEFVADAVQRLDVDERFDCVFVIGVLHHIDDVEQALATMYRALRPGGWLLVNEPQPGNPLIRLARRIRKRIDRSYSDDQVEFDAAELRSMLAACGLREVDTSPQGYLSTPFAEVPLPSILLPFTRLAITIDRWLGRRRAAPRLAWNCIAVGRKP